MATALPWVIPSGGEVVSLGTWTKVNWVVVTEVSSPRPDKERGTLQRVCPGGVKRMKGR